MFTTDPRDGPEPSTCRLADPENHLQRDISTPKKKVADP
jgi:hypothetical protein